MNQENKKSDEVENPNNEEETPVESAQDAEDKVTEVAVDKEVIEIKGENVDTAVPDLVEVTESAVVEIRGVGGGFMSARAVLLNEAKESALSPGFRSAAALAGWDDEALLLASFEEDSSLEDAVTASQLIHGSPVRDCRERKREARTPALAKTPLSAGRRNRRVRTQNADIIVLPRVGALSLEDEPDADNDVPNAVVQPPHVEGNAVQDETSPVGTLSNGKNSSPLKAEASNPKAETSPAGSEKGSSKPRCLDQLREELSCAVCLDICFEPSTTSCGHSFCKTCLQTVIEKCGPRCPKCRQPLRGEFQTCHINTVLWNMVQLLFPKEVAEKIKAQNEKNAALKLEQMKEKSNTYINQASRGVRNNGSNWQGHPSRGIGLSRTTSSTNFRRAFQSAAASSQRTQIIVSDEEAEREEIHVGNVEQEVVERSGRATRRQDRRRRDSNTQEDQQDFDATLASRLQQEELMRSFRGGGRSRLQNRRGQPAEQTRSVSSAAANLRAMASRAMRLRVRNQS